MEANPVATGKQGALRLGADLVFVDESGFMLTPTVARTSAPRGQTPVLRHSQRHDRISVISGVTVSPTRRRVGPYFQWHHHNVRDIEAVAFLRHLLRHLRGQIILVWDRLGVHRSHLVQQLCRRVPRLRLEFLPAYAPKLNPDEGVWRQTKQRLANHCPTDRYKLALAVIAELKALRRSPSRLWARIKHTRLVL
jgi:transposase